MKARDNLGRLLDEVYKPGNEVVIQRAGKAMAVLVPMGRYEERRQEQQERFTLLGRIKTRRRKIPAKRLTATIDEAVRAVQAGVRASPRSE